ncbi:TRPM8 channel-associated factor 3-like isoform X2 [Bradysia coprophila]|uniref:TRPM8 channel-associated factor 3-like isoform X2 n=1 Tax=Bradysia coprophila TaxID=38358 RepID=UPI00187DCCA3|nr:TRPM8 channel-associated factor 3-like isoform X2 [Bradysia coprophila]
MLQLSITGGIRSPTYFMGKTLVSQWRNEIRNSTAPWGELIGENLIILTQNQYLSQMDDPEAIIDFWNRVLDAISDLGALPRERVKSERFVADVQISGGSMHSGYPIMYLLSEQNKPLRISEFRANPSRLWGHLHELGHNHQKSDWTFSGTGEVTCNLFVLYVMHNILLAPTNQTHPRLSDAIAAQSVRQYINDGKRFSDWKSTPFLALLTYIQLQEYFGWSSYQRVFSNYNQLTEGERPKNDQEKIDLWMIMFSRVVEENLTPFFTSWGFPISPGAESKVEDLPSTTLRIRDP